jgi:ArsR family transcriptional regulator
MKPQPAKPSLRAIWQSLSDPTRVRMMLLLEAEELSVAELQQILKLSQPLISTHLSVLRKAGWVQMRKEGKNSYYTAEAPQDKTLLQILQAARLTVADTPEAGQDRASLREVLQRRRIDAQNYFNRVAGKLGRAYCPGRSWSAVGPLLAQLVPPGDIADLGAGEGWLTLLLAQRARRVIAVDNSEKMVAFARNELKSKKIENVEYRLGDLSAPPIEAASMDLVVMSQALHHAVNPRQAVQAASQLLRPGGRLVILDLNSHHFDKARSLYHDYWLGFNEPELRSWMKDAGMVEISIQLLEPDLQPPHLTPMLASGTKA